MTDDKKETEDKNSFDYLLKEYIGPGGRWQYLTFIMVVIPMSLPLSVFPVFAQITPLHRCQIPLLDMSNSSTANFTYSQITKLTIPLKPDPNLPPVIGQEYQPCQRYTMGWLIEGIRVTNGSFEALLEFRNTQYNKNETETCLDGYAYNTTLKEHQGTVIEDFNLVCDQAFWDPLATSIYLFIRIAILTIGGFISDRIGRKKVMCTSAFLSLICIGCTSLSPNITCYVCLRAMVSLCLMTNYTQGFIYLMEITNSFHRNVLSTLIPVSYGIVGLSLLTTFSYVLPSWRWVHFAIGCACLVVFVMIFAMRESPRWLMATGREEEAFEVIKCVAKFNNNGKSKLTLTDEQLKETIHNAIESRTTFASKEASTRSLPSLIGSGVKGILILFRFPKLRVRTLVTSLFWFHIVMDYYMMNFLSTKLAGNAYLNFWLINVSTALPAAILQYLLLWKVGRKWPIVILTYILVGIFIGVTAYQIFETKNVYSIWLVVALSFGKVLIQSSFAITYLYTPELYSTDVCSYGSGTCSTFGRIGSGLSPLIVHLGSSTWRPIPMITACVVSFVATTGVLLVLPETNKKPIHATVAELEAEPDGPLFGECSARRRNNKNTMKNEVEITQDVHEVELEKLM